MLVISGSVRVHPAKREQALAAARSMVAATRQEPGCVAYRFSVDIDDPDLIHIFEEWESAGALASHFASPHMAVFMAAMPGVVAGAPALRRYEVSSAAPM